MTVLLDKLVVDFAEGDGVSAGNDKLSEQLGIVGDLLVTLYNEIGASVIHFGADEGVGAGLVVDLKLLYLSLLRVGEDKYSVLISDSLVSFGVNVCVVGYLARFLVNVDYVSGIGYVMLLVVGHRQCVFLLVGNDVFVALYHDVIFFAVSLRVDKHVAGDYLLNDGGAYAEKSNYHKQDRDKSLLGAQHAFFLCFFNFFGVDRNRGLGEYRFLAYVVSASSVFIKVHIAHEYFLLTITITPATNITTAGTRMSVQVY